MDTAQVTLLTCYYVQQYYQPNHQESIGEKEKCEVVALGCIFIACKVADLPRRIKNVVRAYNQILQEEKRPELSDEQQSQLVEKMIKIEFLVVRAVAFHFDVLMPLQFLDEHTDRLIEGLFSYEAFANAYPHDRKHLRKLLYTNALKFAVESYSGNPELSKCVEHLSLGSMVFSARYNLRRGGASVPGVSTALDQMPDFVNLIAKEELTEEQRSHVNKTIEGIMKVFRGKRKA